MNQLRHISAFAIIAVTGLLLMACSKTSTSSDTNSNPASYCQRSWDGQMRDQYNRVCSNYSVGNNSCVNARYNPQTGQYTDLNTGMPVSCNSQGYFDGYNSVPYYGYSNGQAFAGCQGYAYYPPYQQYVPFDLGNGQLICLNANYLYQVAPSMNWYQYAQYQQPVYACQGYDCYGGGGYGYTCDPSINFSFDFGFGGVSIGACGRGGF